MIYVGMHIECRNLGKVVELPKISNS